MNTDPKSFNDVRVYAADPWYPPVDGEIKNLKIANEASGNSSLSFAFVYLILSIICLKKKDGYLSKN